MRFHIAFLVTIFLFIFFYPAIGQEHVNQTPFSLKRGAIHDSSNDRDHYGGWKGIKKSATGFFRIEKVNFRTQHL